MTSHYFVQDQTGFFNFENTKFIITGSESDFADMNRSIYKLYSLNTIRSRSDC